MAKTRNINEYLGSGETKSIVVGENLSFKVGQDGSTDGMFLRSDANGNIIGYVAPNQDIEWLETVGTDITLDDVETFLISLQIDNDVSAANGSYAFSCKLKNGSSNRSDNITFIVRDQDGTALASKMVAIDKGEEAFPATFYGKFLNDHPSGTTFSVYAYSNNNTIARGSLTPIGLKVTEAKAAPITLELIQSFNWNELPQLDPGISGQLYSDNGIVTISKG